MGLFSIKTVYTDKKVLFNMWHILMDDPLLKGWNRQHLQQNQDSSNVSTDCDSSLKKKKIQGRASTHCPPGENVYDLSI